MKVVLKTCMAFLLLLLYGCSKDEYEKEIYLAGEPIPGVEIFFPMDFYDAGLLMPKISPDGKKLLFTGPASLPEWRGLWVMDMETQERTLLHKDGMAGGWAPDSEWIAFNIGTQIYKMKINGTGLTQLTFEGRNFLPDWSPDGNSILYDNTDCGSVVDPIPENSCGVLRLDFNRMVKKLVVPFVRNPKWFPNQLKFLTSGGVIFDSIGNSIDTLPLQEGYRGADISINGQIILSNSKGIILLNESTFLKRIIPNHLYNSSYQGNINLYSAYPSWHPDGKHIIYEHFEITRSKRFNDDTTHVEGYIKFYKVNVDSAINRSNL